MMMLPMLVFLNYVDMISAEIPCAGLKRIEVGMDALPTGESLAFRKEDYQTGDVCRYQFQVGTTTQYSHCT